MKELSNRILALEEISEALEPSEQQRAEYHQQMQSFSNDFINTIHERNAFLEKKDAPQGLGIDNEAKPLKNIISMYQEKVLPFGINPASGGHVGYIPGGGIYSAAIGDYIADVSNEYAGIFYGSPGAVTIENETIDWIKNVFGFPNSAIGNLTSGGSIANLIAMTCARDKHGIKNAKIPTAVVYLSPQVHHCITKALRIIGLEDVIVRKVDLDEKHRMKPSDLRQKIQADKAEGLNPFLVIASSGTTDTGAIDPLNEFADIAQEENLWFHVDGAYGGFFILCESKKEMFKGIERADSLVVDPHKSLFLPYGTGAVLIRDREIALHSHRYIANYMQDSMGENLPVNPADVSPELTKHFRGLRLWLPLQMYGIKPFIACLEEKILLTEYFRKRLLKIGFDLGPIPDLSVSYFWYPSEDIDQNEFNQKLLELIHKDGRVFLSSTNLNGKFVIRMAILSFRTKKKTIDKAMDMIEEALLQLSVSSKQLSV